MTCPNCQSENLTDYPVCPSCATVCHFSHRNDCVCLGCTEADVARAERAAQSESWWSEEGRINYGFPVEAANV